jgi:hypothetical protein
MSDWSFMRRRARTGVTEATYVGTEIALDGERTKSLANPLAGPELRAWRGRVSISAKQK